MTHCRSVPMPVLSARPLRAGREREGEDIRWAKDRRAYLVPSTGAIRIDDVRVNARDGAAISDLDVIRITAYRGQRNRPRRLRLTTDGERSRIGVALPSAEKI